jgi:hypothetical protein
LPCLLWVALGQQLHGPLEVGKEHRDLLALAFESGLGGEDFLSEVVWCVRLRRTGGFLCRCGWRLTGPSATGPDQDLPVFIHRQLLGINQVFLERFERVVIKLQPEFEDAIGEAFESFN